MTGQTVYCTYNGLKCAKKMFEKLNHGHGNRPKDYDPVRNAWLRQTLEM